MTASRLRPGHGSCSRGKAYYARRGQSRVCGKHRAVLRPRSPPRILSLSQEVAAPETCDRRRTFDFMFKNVEKQYESYPGHQRQAAVLHPRNDIAAHGRCGEGKGYLVHSFRMPADSNSSIKMEVGIEDCLHIEFEYNKSKYHLKDVIVGKIYFLLVRIKIKHMELSIIRRETTGSPPNQYNESETITKFEIMDGAPVRGETIPIRLFLGGFDLTP
ncbi:vacuolar protein sorting-associated protein 26-domain-containing protein, partial [Lactarius hengduanensis]